MFAIAAKGTHSIFLFFFKQKTAYEIASCLVGSEMCIRDRRRTNSHLKFFDISFE